MFLKCCLIHIISPRHFLYLVYLCLYPCLGLFMFYLYDLFFIIIFIFSIVNHVISLKQTVVFLNIFFKLPGCWLAFAYFFCQTQSDVTYESVVFKKVCIQFSISRIITCITKAFAS